LAVLSNYKGLRFMSSPG